MKILLAGETFAATTSVAIGSDVLTTAASTNGATAFNAALATEGIAVTQIGGERCSAEFPYDLDGLAQYQAVVISDVGALTLLLTPDARAGRVGVNRLDVLKAYVEAGGGLMLAGGYMGFQGMFGTARSTTPRSRTFCRSVAYPTATAWRCRKACRPPSCSRHIRFFPGWRGRCRRSSA